MPILYVRNSENLNEERERGEIKGIQEKYKK